MRLSYNYAARTADVSFLSTIFVVNLEFVLPFEGDRLLLDHAFGLWSQVSTTCSPETETSTLTLTCPRSSALGHVSPQLPSILHPASPTA